MKKNNRTCDISKRHRHQMIYNILKQLGEESALSISEIHKRICDEGVKVTRKTIERDMPEVSENFKLLETENHPAKYYSSPDFTPDYELFFNEEELQTITLALDNLKQTSPQYLRRLCLETENTLISKLPKSLARDLKNFKKLHHFSYGINGRAVAKDDKSFEVIMKCLRSGNAFHCQNISPYKDEEYNIRQRFFAPLLFLMSGSIPYLIVRDLGDTGEIKTLRMTRLVNAVVSENKVVPIKKDEMKNIEFTFGGYSGSGKNIVDYEIIGTKVLATYFKEREIHSTQKIEILGENRFKVTFRLSASFEIIKILKGLSHEIVEVKPSLISKQLSSFIKDAA